VFLFLAMIVVALPRWFHGASGIAPATPPIALTFPAFSLLTLNILGKMGFGAFGGFDGVGIFAGECRSTDVAKAIRRSVWLAAPIIAAMFIAGTASVLAFSTPATIDLVAPMTQVLNLGAPQLAGLSALLLVLTLRWSLAGIICCPPGSAGWIRATALPPAQCCLPGRSAPRCRFSPISGRATRRRFSCWTIPGASCSGSHTW
jgi:hypothetical protein